ncbi:MAG: hypothetical protein HY718_02035 [Planctomycetes bacterium]|nr:hypothetical protein [Planctomycetota bacterium]
MLKMAGGAAAAMAGLLRTGDAAVLEPAVREVVVDFSREVGRIKPLHGVNNGPFHWGGKDFAKWAKICVNIIRHYNEGWADGFHYNIRYWEIWNEPNVGNSMRSGTRRWKHTASMPATTLPSPPRSR